MIFSKEKRISKANLFCFFFVVVALLMFALPNEAKAERDGDPKEIYHDWYIPFAPDMDNCYGVYRLSLSEKRNMYGMFAGKMTMNQESSLWNHSKVLPVNYATETFGLGRDDLFVFTDFALKTQRVEYLGNSINYHTYHYETPAFVLGESVYTTPVDGNGLDYESGIFMITRDNAYKNFKRFFTLDGFAEKITPMFAGDNPQGEIKFKKQVEANRWMYILAVDKEKSSKVPGFMIPPIENSIVAPLLKDESAIGWWRLYLATSLRVIDDARKGNSGISSVSAGDVATIKKSATEAWQSSGKKTEDRDIYEAVFDPNTISMVYNRDVLAAFYRKNPVISDFNGDLFTFFDEYKKMDFKNMNSLWVNKAVDIAEELKPKIGAKIEVEERTSDIASSAMSGMSLKTVDRRANKQDSKLSYAKKHVKAGSGVLSPPFKNADGLDILVPINPSEWNIAEEGYTTMPVSRTKSSGKVSSTDRVGHASGSGNFLEIISYTPDALARWPYAMAQRHLYRYGYSTVQRLNPSVTAPEDVIMKINEAGGFKAYLQNYLGWEFLTNKDVPKPTSSVLVISPVIDYGHTMTNSNGKNEFLFGESPWETWRNKDKEFYKEIIPHLAKEFKSLHWKAAGVDGLYFMKTKEMIYEPKLVFVNHSQIKDFDTIKKEVEFQISPSGIVNQGYFDSVKGESYFAAGSFKMEQDRFNKVKKSFDKIKSYFASGSFEGEEYSAGTMETRLAYIPGDVYKLQEVAKSMSYVSSGMEINLVYFPDLKQFERIWKHCPIEDTYCTPPQWGERFIPGTPFPENPEKPIPEKLKSIVRPETRLK